VAAGRSSVRVWGWGVVALRGWEVDGEVGEDGKRVGGGGREGGRERAKMMGGVWPIDRRPRPPRDGCGYKSSVREMYGGNGGLGHDKRGVTSTNLDEL